MALDMVGEEAGVEFRVFKFRVLGWEPRGRRG